MITQSLVSSGGNITLSGAGNIGIGFIQALAGHVAITAVGSITDVDGDTAADVQAITITLVSSQSSIGGASNDLEIDTADTVAGLLSAAAAGNVYVTERSGRLNVQHAQSVAAGDVRLATTETSASGEDIIAWSVVSSAPSMAVSFCWLLTTLRWPTP